MAARAALSTGNELTGRRKAAILCMALGTEAASKVMQKLAPEEVESISLEIASLPMVQSDVSTQVVGEFIELAKAVQTLSEGGVEVARTMLEAALGPMKGATVFKRIQEQMSGTGLQRLRTVTPELLQTVLRGEHPQTMALILAHLDRRQAAAVLEALDSTFASDVLYRMARMEKVAPEMLQIVETALAGKTDLSLTQQMTASGGPDTAAQILLLMGTTLEKQLLGAIAERNTELADAIKGLMFVFEDLRTIDDRAMQRLLRDVDGKDLALAYKAASEELRQHIIKAMSERAAAALIEEVEFLGPVRVKDVEAAQSRILAQLRTLEESGEVVITSGRGGQDALIA